MDKIELPIAPLDYKYLLIAIGDADSHNLHMGGARTKKEIMKIARLHKNWTEKIIYKKLEEIK